MSALPSLFLQSRQSRALGRSECLQVHRSISFVFFIPSLDLQFFLFIYFATIFFSFFSLFSSSWPFRVRHSENLELYQHNQFHHIPSFLLPSISVGSLCVHLSLFTDNFSVSVCLIALLCLAFGKFQPARNS